MGSLNTQIAIGKRVDAQSAAEIEQRNARLAEFEEKRAQRRAEAEEEDEAEEEEQKEEKPGSKPAATPVQQTTEAEHKRNLAKLERA